MNYSSQHGEIPLENVEGRATGRSEAIYEPRALWQVTDVPFLNKLGVPGAEVVLEGTEWMNGSRYDFVLTHMLLCPINYAVIADANEVMQNISVSIAHGATPITVDRFGPAYGLLQPIAPSPTFSDRSTGQQVPYDFAPLVDPPTVNPRTRLVLAAQPRIFDVARWQFDQPYRLARRGIVQFGLSSCGAPGTRLNADLDKMRVTMGFDEAWSSGGGMRMQMRTQLGKLIVGSGAGTPWGPPVQSGPSLDTTLDAVMWPAESQFSPKEWKRQEAGRGGGDGSGWLQGFTVHLPNYANVDGLDRVPGASADDSGVSLATRLGVRASTTNGGTGRNWWRPGAPLALVTPTVGASHCVKLQAPLRLGSREQIRLVLRSSGRAGLLSGLNQLGDTLWEQDRINAGSFKVGISLTGYAIVKD